MQAGKLHSLLLLGLLSSAPLLATSASVSNVSIQEAGLASTTWSVSGLAGSAADFSALSGASDLAFAPVAMVEAPSKPQVKMVLGAAAPSQTVMPGGATLATEVFKPSIAARERGAKGFDSATLFLAGGLALLGTVLFRSRIFS